MSSKNSKKSSKGGKLFSEFKSVFLDIIFAYKNFIHWNISKICISLWCFILGVILSLPVFIIAIVVGLFDPIEWSQIAAYILTGDDVSFQIISGIAMHPYNLIFMVFLFVVGIFLFLLGSSYSLFLKSELSLGYVKGKKLKYSKNYYFNRGYIFRYIGIMCWNIAYIIAPIIIWVGVVFFMYLFFNVGFISLDVLSTLTALYTLVLILAELYLAYRIVFGYIILADDSKKKHLGNSIHYVKKSIEITKGSSFFKFLGLYCIYIMLIAPVTLFDGYLEKQGELMDATMKYNNGLLQNLESHEIEYYEYISKEFSGMSNDDLNKRINSLIMLRFMLYFFSYIAISGIFVLLLTSFYRRVLLQK